jgi:hypothetical protein
MTLNDDPVSFYLLNGIMGGIGLCVLAISLATALHLMSDTTKVSDGVHVNHYCCLPDCKKWGGFGFVQNKVDPVKWWRWEHYPYKEPPPK